MTPEELKRIENLENVVFSLVFPDKYEFKKNLKLNDGVNIQVAKGTGTTIGTETTQKVGFHGSASIQADTIAALSVVGSDTDGEARTAINSILTVLKNKGIIASS